MDALSKGIQRRIEKAPFYLKWLFKIESKRLANYERQIFDYFENQIIISEQDRELILHPNKAKIHCIPNGVDNSFFEKIDETKKYDLLFVGNMSYAPNIEAANYISTELIPNLKKSNPTISFLISGANPHSSILKLAKNNSTISVSGWIDDIRTSYAQGKIFIAPMMIGTGMQNKLIEAMAMGIPCITTSLANNAIKALHNESIIVANTKEEFIEAIEKLLSDSLYYSKIAEGGKSFVKQNYNWKSTTQKLISIFEA
jgi:glycosyltransferase involved in cell wall biosynthesis